MKLYKTRKQKEEGGFLVATLIATLIVGLVLVGYMTLVGSANRDGVMYPSASSSSLRKPSETR